MVLVAASSCGALFRQSVHGGRAGQIAYHNGLTVAPMFVSIAGLTSLPAMLSVGLLISTLSRRSSVALGVAIFVWLTLVFLGDLACTSYLLRAA